jgi:Stress responsive A/B Barrel Domain
MIVHIVMYTPKATLSAAEHDTFGAALETALSSIPSVRRYHVGRRYRTGAMYEQLAPIDFSYCGVLEFDDAAGLSTYLAHPAHEELGRLFYVMSEHALACDFETVQSRPAAALTQWRAGD